LKTRDSLLHRLAKSGKEATVGNDHEMTQVFLADQQTTLSSIQPYLVLFPTKASLLPTEI
jgi:hypothetical protein